MLIGITRETKYGMKWSFSIRMEAAIFERQCQTQTKYGVCTVQMSTILLKYGSLTAQNDGEFQFSSQENSEIE